MTRGCSKVGGEVVVVVVMVVEGGGGSVEEIKSIETEVDVGA